MLEKTTFCPNNSSFNGVEDLGCNLMHFASPWKQNQSTWSSVMLFTIDLVGYRVPNRLVWSLITRYHLFITELLSQLSLLPININDLSLYYTHNILCVAMAKCYYIVYNILKKIQFEGINLKIKLN